MDGHPLISQILLERAMALAQRPPETTVVLIAHGPNDDEENARWLQDMAAHARYVRARGRFRVVQAVTHRNDAPPTVKTAARKTFRAEVAKASERGEVIVVPLLLSAGGIEGEAENDLRGLSYRFAQPLMPHANVVRWAQRQAEALLR